MNDKFAWYAKEKQKYETLTIVGTIILVIGFISFIPLSSQGGPNPLSILMFVGGAILSGFARKGFKNLSNDFKTNFLTKEIEKIYPGTRFNVHSGFSSHEIYGSHILTKQDRYHSEDMIMGEYEGVAFRTADVTLKDVRRSGKTTRVVTVFQGPVYEFEFNKEFRSNLLLLQPGNFRIFGRWSRVKLESVQFNSEIKVLAEDEHEAFYILTPHFMERILRLDRKYYDKINFSFINNKLMISIDTREDRFDLKMFQVIDDSIIKRYTHQLNDIKDFIHELNLDNDLFKPKR